MPRAGWVATGALVAAAVGCQGTDLLAVGEPGAPTHGLLPVIMAAAAALALATYGAWRRSRGALAAAAGAGLVTLRLAAGLAAPSALPAGPLPSSLHGAEAEVVSVSTPSNGVQRAVVRLEDPAEQGRRLYARLPRYPEVVPGDRVRVDGGVRPPPDGPGFGDYLRRAGIAGTLTARGLERVPAQGGPAAWLERRRRDAGELLAQTLPAPQAGLAAGILVGLRDQVDREVADAFTSAGLTHIVAISGWNIAVVAGVVSAFLRRVGRRRRSLATLAAVAAYALAAGAGASVIRAATMAGAVIGSREIGRPSGAAAALGIAVVVMLAVDPSVIGDAGFQLSAAATAGLLAWASPLTEWLRRHLARPQSRLAAPGWLLDSLGVSLAAQAATLPLVLLDFGRVSLVSPVANLVAAPLVVPVMAASAAALATGWLVSLGVPAIAGALAGSAGAVVLGALIAVGNLAAAIPGASVTLQPPVAELAAATAAGVLALVALPGPRQMMLRRIGPGRVQPPPVAAAASRRTADPWARFVRPLSLLAASALVALVLVGAARPDGRLCMTVLDVGQGDAILLRGPAGGRILVDTGPDPERLLPRLDAVAPPWDRRIDLLVLTHPHEDHVGGAALLLRRYRVAAVAEPGMRGTGPGWTALADELAAGGRSTVRLAAGDRLELDGATITVLWPRAGAVPETPGETGSAVNDVSIVLDVRYGTRRFLLMGDAEEAVDAALLANGTLDAGQPRVDVLKVAHHGSRTATTAALLAAIRPAVALVSVGTPNDYGHPVPATLQRLRSAGARILRTDQDGTVTVSTDGTDLLVESRTGTWAGDRTGTPDGHAYGCIESRRGALARRSRRHPARTRSTRLAARPFRRRRRDRRVPGGALRRSWRGGRSRARRGGGPAP